MFSYNDRHKPCPQCNAKYLTIVYMLGKVEKIYCPSCSFVVLIDDIDMSNQK